MLAPIVAFGLLLNGAPVPIPDPSFARAAAETKNFTRGRPSGIRFAPDGSEVFFLESEARSPALKLLHATIATGKSEVLVTPEELLGGKEEQLGAAERARRERLRQTERGFTQFDLSRDGQRLLLPLSGKVYVFERATRKVFPVYSGDEPALDPRLSPTGQSLAYIKGSDLYVADVATGKETRLTQGGNNDLLHGVAEFIAQEELDRFSGFWWSPDGERLAYTEVDQHGVEHFTIADPAHPEQPGEVFAYPRPGKANATVRLGLISRSGGATTWLDWDHERYPYLTDVLWDEPGAPLTVVVSSRDQRDLSVLVLDAASNKLRELFHLHDDAWIEPGMGLYGWAQGGKNFVDVTPAGELELRDTKGQKIRTLLAADAGLREVVLVRSDAAYVTASTDPFQSQFWKIPLDGTTPTQLTKEPGEHHITMAEHAFVWSDAFTDATHLPRVRLHNEDKDAGELPMRAEEPSFLPKAEMIQVTSASTKRTYSAIVLRPRNFKPGQHYPVIDSVYGGPHHNQAVPMAAALLLDQWYADHGFIVVRLDGRGTPRHGHDWERAIKLDLGTVPVEDHADALAALGKKYRELDLTRVGIHGWSFGGYMSALAVLEKPELFKVGVAGAPVTDWADYDTAYTERYMETPEQNAAGYERSSVLTHAKDLSRPLLVLHGTSDDNVYFFHSLKLMDALFRAGKRADFLPLENLTHIVADPGAREHLYSMIIDYFVEHLQKQPPKK